MINQIAKQAYQNAKHLYGDEPYKDVYEKIKEENNELLLAHVDNLYSDINNYSDFETEIKDSIGDEMADIILVVLASSVKHGIDIEKHILAKNEYNKNRER